MGFTRIRTAPSILSPRNPQGERRAVPGRGTGSVVLVLVDVVDEDLEAADGEAHCAVRVPAGTAAGDQGLPQVQVCSSLLRPGAVGELVKSASDRWQTAYAGPAAASGRPDQDPARRFALRGESWQQQH